MSVSGKSLTVASILACAFSLKAQIVATLNPLPNGSNEVRIRNEGTVALSAVAIGAQLHTGIGAKASPKWPIKLYADAVVDMTSPLLPGGERSAADRIPLAVAISKPLVIYEQPIVTAGIFADGMTTGDAALLAGLTMRRRNMLLAVDTALDILSSAGQRNVPPSWLIDQFRRLTLSHWYLAVEQEVGHDLYESILGKLVNLPGEPLGSPFPPTAFVEQETAMLRQRRAILVESRPSLEDTARGFR